MGLAAARQAGIHRQISQPGGRRYTIAIPQNYADSQPVPLVLALHWGGPVFPFIGESLLAGLMEPALRDLRAIILAPDRSTEDWANPQSEADLIELLDLIQDRYRIDESRSLITGYSLGGIGAWYMAARRPDRFAAALPISARPPSDSAGVQWKIPLYVIHGRQDEIFPLPATETIVRKLQAKGYPIELLILDRTSHYETDRFIEPLQAAAPWIQRAWRRQ